MDFTFTEPSLEPSKDNSRTVLCKSDANGIRRISLFFLAIFRLNKGRFFVEISPRNENWWRKVSLQSLVFKISLRTDNSLLRVIKFVYRSCKQHEIWNILKPISNLFQSPKTHHVRFWARSVDDKGNRVNCPKYLTLIPIMIHVLGWNYLPDESRYFAHQLQFPDV